MATAGLFGYITCQECGLKAKSIKELGTFDLIFDTETEVSYALHGITTVFKINVDESSLVTIDDYSSDYAWKSAKKWIKEIQHEYLLKILKKT